MPNRFDQLPEVTPQPVQPEIDEDKNGETPIEVIEGALDDLKKEDDDEVDERPPTIH